MAYLSVYTDGDPARRVSVSDVESEIHGTLGDVGVGYSRWNLVDGLADDASADEVLAAYGEPIEALRAREGYILVDVAAVRPSGAPDAAAAASAARARFLAEHTHDDDEVRFFAAGSGLFYLHIGDRVYAVLGERGDLLTVPRGTTHWFDMGTNPDFTAVRFFRDAEGWVGAFTGEEISERIPDFDTIVSGRAAAVSAGG
jgi:1,2-dihydroxy-3-keto-5-methylthiopentene dioxygenase